MRAEEFRVDSRDKKTKLYARYWIPDGEIKCILQIVHGMAEHIGRYDEMASWFASQGILVVGEDMLGHGQSLDDYSTPGYFTPLDPATVVVRDVHRLKKITEEKYPGVPYFILGHSMGSFILRNYIFRYGKGIKGAIICGTGSKPKLLVKAGLLITNIIQLFCGDHHKSTLLSTLAFGNKSKIPEDHRNDWLCTDHKVVEKYDADPLCGFLFTVNGFKTLFTLIDRQNSKKNIEKMPNTLPVLFISGSEDQVGDCSKGVKKVFDEYKSLGMEDVDCILYEGLRHEILNEPSREKVFSDVFEWINKRI